jgi:branched-chain amino acid transport system substrate-binding protein
VLKRSKEIGNPKATAEAIAATRLDTVVGHVAWNGKDVPPFAAKNVTKTSLVGGQWRTRDGKRYEIVIVDNKTAPNIPLGGKMEAIA